MRSRLRFHPGARTELHEAVVWYEDDYPGRGVRFRHAVEHELEQVLSAPASFPNWRRHHSARYVVVPHFPYTVIFAIDPLAVMVYAVAHDKRRPGYWRPRLTTA